MIFLEFTDEIDNNHEMDDDDDDYYTGPSKYLLSIEEDLQSFNSLRTYFEALGQNMNTIFLN